jgi:formate/nitrite transporter FocA (FNT family)
VSWGAVIAGAFAAAALSLTLLALGAGFGLLTVSPWSHVRTTSLEAAAIIWLIVIQIVASGIGGYIAGRLRTKWVAVHSHEVYFRDTAHGFIAWAVAVVISAAFLGPAATAMVGGTTLGPDMAGAGNAYLMATPTYPGRGAPGDIGGDRGIGQNDATQRPSDVLAQARQEADAARKATARLLLWTFVALLIGAFCASYAATIGGRQRDHMPAV